MEASTPYPCESNPDMWFDEGYEVEASALCRQCPFRTKCLATALEFEKSEKYLWGVYGGLTAVERLRLLGRES